MPCPGSLVVKKASYARAADVRRHTGPGVTNLDDHRVVDEASDHAEDAMSVHRVEGVVDEVGPNLVQLSGIRIDVRDVVGKVAYDRDAWTESVPEHRERALQTVPQIDALQRGAVHVRVDADIRDQPRDAARRVLELAEERGNRCCARHPAQAWLEGRPVEHGRGSLAPIDVHTSRRERWCDAPDIDDTLGVEPGRYRLLAVTAGQWIALNCPPVELATQRVERAELLGGDLVVGQVAEGRQQRPSLVLEQVDCPARRGGRVVDLVGQTGGQRPERDQ